MSLTLKHFTAMVLIGDGLMALAIPERDAKAWRLGPEPWRSMMGFLADRPQLTRLVGLTQVVVGLWWVMREEKSLSRA
jgi:uncharacterized protein YjeT (DUF2065 family)